MTNLELLNILTNVRGEYILQAQELRSGNRKQPLRRLHRKRVLLIAAVISLLLLLLLVGCVAAFLVLRDLSLGTFVKDDNFGGTVSGELLSLQGYVETPEYMATKGWLAFSDNYDSDHKLMDSSAYDDYNPRFVCTKAPGHEVNEFTEMPMFWEPISADEMSNIRDAYTKMELPKKPIGELLADDTDIDISQLTFGSSETTLSLFDNILVPLIEGRLPNRAREFKAILERYGYTYRDGEGLFTIIDPAHPESYLFGGNSLLYDTDTISTIGFCTETESGEKKVEVYLFTEEQEYYIINPSYTRNKKENFEQLKAYIAQR